MGARSQLKSHGLKWPEFWHASIVLGCRPLQLEFDLSENSAPYGPQALHELREAMPQLSSDLPVRPGGLVLVSGAKSALTDFHREGVRYRGLGF